MQSLRIVNFKYWRFISNYKIEIIIEKIFTGYFKMALWRQLKNLKKSYFVIEYVLLLYFIINIYSSQQILAEGLVVIKNFISRSLVSAIFLRNVTFLSYELW